MYLGLALAWLVPLCVCISYTVGYFTQKRTAMATYVGVLSVIVVAFISVISLATTVALRQHRRSNDVSRNSLAGLDQKIARLGGMVVLTLLIFFMPAIIAQIFR